MKVIVLDEYGAINSQIEKERYFIFGGIIYDLGDLPFLKERIVKVMDKIRTFKKIAEVKSSKICRNHDSTLTFGCLAGMLASLPEIKTINYIIDKTEASFINKYDKISFKYNFIMLEMYKELVNEGYIGENEDVHILVDEITFSRFEKDNMENWLPNQVTNIKSVRMANSEEFNFIQLADVIAGTMKLNKKNFQGVSRNSRLEFLKIDFIKVFPRKSMKNINGFEHIV